MLYPAHIRVGRVNIVLRHSVPHFSPNSWGIARWVAELNAALCLDARARNENICKFKSIFHFLEWGTNPQPVMLHSTTVTHLCLCATTGLFTILCTILYYIMCTVYYITQYYAINLIFFDILKTLLFERLLTMWKDLRNSI